MNPIRRATPDSEAVASSEDERPWPAASAFGSLPRKENGVPGLGGGIWAQKRGSISKMSSNVPNPMRDARLGPPATSPNLLRSSPSPSASEGSAALPFSIPLHPTPKLGRSLSHSQGQREPSGAHSGGAEQPPALPLGLLPEEIDTEDESDLGGRLTHTVSHPAHTFHRPAFYPPIFDPVRTPSDSGEPGRTGNSKYSKADHNPEGAFINSAIDHQSRRLWESHLGWEDLPGANESRRHSLADIPTRRGSINAQGHGTQLRGGAYWSPRSEEFEFGHQGDYSENTLFPTKSNVVRSTHSEASEMKFNDKDEQGQGLEVPSMYKVPYIEIAEHERTEADKRNAALASPGQFGRPRKLLFIVSFKCSRVDVFYLLDNTGLFIKEGDIVIVEADRGQDLGTVQHANVTQDEARLYKRKYGEEQYKWLMMFSNNNAQGSVNPNAQVESQAARNLLAGAPPSMQGLPRDNFNTLKPKAIKRLASSHEIRMLGEKEGNEAKAKRTCQQKVNHLHLDMEILDAEWQWDFQKLIFYYYADHYINFKDLITELYRIYKTRIWLSAINPASFSQHALGQPPSGIGPGAIGAFNGGGVNNTYTMAYGADPDPYGAVPPYRIGYETYTPNYPGIPGVANSFAPPAGAFQPSSSATPSVAPGIAPTGTMEDYNFYYDRSSGAGPGAGAGANEDGNSAVMRPPFHPGAPPGAPSSFTPAGFSGGPLPAGGGFPFQGAIPRLGAIGARGLPHHQPSNGNIGASGAPPSQHQQPQPSPFAGSSFGGVGLGSENAFPSSSSTSPALSQHPQQQQQRPGDSSQRRLFSGGRLSGSNDFVPSPLLTQGMGQPQAQAQHQRGSSQQQVTSPSTTTTTSAGGERTSWGSLQAQQGQNQQGSRKDETIHSYLQGLQVKEDGNKV